MKWWIIYGYKEIYKRNVRFCKGLRPKHKLSEYTLTILSLCREVSVEELCYVTLKSKKSSFNLLELRQSCSKLISLHTENSAVPVIIMWSAFITSTATATTGSSTSSAVTLPAVPAATPYTKALTNGSTPSQSFTSGQVVNKANIQNAEPVASKESIIFETTQKPSDSQLLFTLGLDTKYVVQGAMEEMSMQMKNTIAEHVSLSVTSMVKAIIISTSLND